MTAPAVLWEPSPEAMRGANVARFMDWLERERGMSFDGYDALWRWSVRDLAAFWESVWQFFDVRASSPYVDVLDDRAYPGTRWFEGSRLNYAEHVLGPPPDDRAALLAIGEESPPVEVPWSSLRRQVGGLAHAMRDLGIGPGDRVAAYLPNVPETVIAMLATASLGAVWVACAPDFGAQSVIDRLGQ